jgi:hypothetical protein
MLTDLFKTSNFVMQLRDQKSIELMNVETDIPGFTIGTLEMGYMSMKDKRPGDSITFENLTMTVNCDEDLKAYKEVWDYLKITHDPLENIIRVSEEVFDGYLLLLTNKNNVQHKIHFYDMWIESISPIQCQSVSPDENNVNFFMFE